MNKWSMHPQECIHALCIAVGSVTTISMIAAGCIVHLRRAPCLTSGQIRRVYGPPETFWEDLEAQVAEGLRQAQRAPRLVDLVTSTERALFLVSQQRHYAALAARLFAQQVATTSVQAAWRGHRVRAWYQNYKNTEAFAARQREYETQMRVRAWAMCR